MKLVVKQLSGG